MSDFPLTPKFVTKFAIDEAVARIVECVRCHTERVLPPGRTQISSICSSCMLELEYELKEKAGTLKEGEARPKRLNPSKRLLEGKAGPLETSLNK